MSEFVIFRGRRACRCLAAWLPVYEAELIRVGEIKKSVDIAQLIGTYVKSGGTHVPGGAADIWQHSKRAVAIAEEMGAAAFARTAAQGFAPHMHLVLKGCPHNAGGRYQIPAREAGFNGLGAGGRGGRDPRGKIQLRSYQAGMRWAKDREKQVSRKPKTRTTSLRCAQMNVRSKTSGFPVRVPVIRARVRKYDPHFLSLTELQPGSTKRGLLSVALRPRWGLSFHAHNKVQYLLTSKNGWEKVRTEKYSLGNNRHAIAVWYRHRGTGAEFVLVTPHLSWQHDAGKERAGEARNLVTYLERDFPGLEKLIAGDLNDSHKKTKTRPVDSSGIVLKAAGYHDMSFDPTNANKSHRSHNTAHQNKTLPPASGIHIDRYWGTAGLAGIEWINDVHGGRRGSDHWLVYMLIRLTHPIKK